MATVDGGVVFSTAGGGVVTETSRNVGVSFTKSSSTRLILTTAADGSVETLTSVVVVNAPVTGSGAEAGSAETSGPGLQDAAVVGASRVGSGVVALVAAAVAVVGGAAWAL